MKKLNKLQINSKKLMKNEELVTIRGGGYGVTVFCYGGEYGTCSFSMAGCEEAASICDLCPGGWTSAVCAG